MKMNPLRKALIPLAGVAVIPTQVSWTVLLIGVALLVTQLVTGRTTRVAYIL